ncbi:MAG: hypothetical protein IJH84_22535, partial [Saccharopolyspora sp.]|uniref:hypothetical protein n=1 Tax=Saccharopolyspora sp. TaxID=33915 RepID=UPI0025E841ED
MLLELPRGTGHRRSHSRGRPLPDPASSTGKAPRQDAHDSRASSGSRPASSSGAGIAAISAEI